MRLLSLRIFVLVLTPYLLAACSSRSGGAPVDSGVASDSGQSGDDASTADLGTGGDAALDSSLSDANVTESDGSIADGSTPDAQSDDLGIVDEDGGAAVDAGLCGFADALETSGCGSDDECRVGIHQINCCGTHYAIGFKSSEEATFSELEPVCAASYPRCRCAVAPTGTDSGETVIPGEEELVNVACVSRGPTSVCMTYVSERPADGV